MPRKTKTGLSDLSGLLDTLQPAVPVGEEPPAPDRLAPVAGPQPGSSESNSEPGLVVLAALPPDEPDLPGFAMADSPDDLPDLSLVSSGASAAAQRPGMADAPPPAGEPQAAALEIPDADISRASTLPGRGGIRYESRIRVLEAFQYPGNLSNAPEWVDRNWVGYAPDYDPLRGIEPGPALRVPTRGGDEVALCRPGDYVVKQSVTLIHGLEPDEVVEVWARESFEKNFIPDVLAPAMKAEIAYESG